MFEQKDIDEARMAQLGIRPDPRLTRWMQSTDDCVKLLSPEGEIVYMSQNGLCAMQIEDLSMVRGRIWWELWPEETRGIVRDAVRTANEMRVARFTADCPTARGTPARWEVTVTAVPGPDGAVQELLSISRRVELT